MEFMMAVIGFAAGGLAFGVVMYYRGEASGRRMERADQMRSIRRVQSPGESVGREPAAPNQVARSARVTDAHFSAIREEWNDKS